MKFYLKMYIFNSFLLLLRWLKRGKTKAKNELHSVIYLLYNSKQLSVLLIGYRVHKRTNIRYRL